MMMRRTFFSILMLATGSGAYAQKASPTVDEVVARVRANIATYRASIPNFSCDESVDSQRLDGTKVKDEMKVQSSFRMTRTDPKQDMRETRIKNLVNGKPPKDQKVFPPYVFSGGFANLPQMLSDPCMEFRFSNSGAFNPEGNIVLIGNAKPASTGTPACLDRKTESEVVIDPNSFQVLRLEATMHDLHMNTSLMAHMMFVSTPSDHNVMKTIVTFSPVPFGEKTFWLPRVVENVITDAAKPIRLRYEATYSNYHRYAATATIVSSGSEALPQ